MHTGTPCFAAAATRFITVFLLPLPVAPVISACSFSAAKGSETGSPVSVSFPMENAAVSPYEAALAENGIAAEGSVLLFCTRIPGCPYSGSCIRAASSGEERRSAKAFFAIAAGRVPAAWSKTAEGIFSCPSDKRGFCV